ncbi:methylmalonyl-CoA mutase family protein [Salmonirosea aquatica]|uniref:methylmalonyl-CoA mutase family protein n=1 Tax=Salmonirosea aquatica TaxID=2654236 RepID=UPI0035711C46
MPKNSWQQKLEEELKGRSFAEVQHEVANHLTMAPYYVAADLAGYAVYKEIQACQRQTPGWLTLPVIDFEVPNEVNQRIRNQLQQGADGIWLDCGSTPLSHLELTKTLHTVRLTDTPVFLDSPEAAPAIISELTQGSSYYLKGGVVYDPVADWMRTGQNFSTAFDGIAQGMALTKAMREFRSYKVESHIFHEAGADVVQELAYTLASFVTYLDQLTERGVSPLLAANRFVFAISVGTDYLTEIAKLRALRYLYQKVTRAYGLPDELCQAYIQGQSSRLYQSAHSSHTNIVRQTAEAMSAVMGGCDALSILPYDAAFAEPSEFSERMARNISLVLKNESYLDKVADPAAGSYYLEILTARLAGEAWAIFLEIESKGGLPKAFEQNFIQQAIEHSWNQKVAEFQNGRVMVGVNKFQEKNEEVPLSVKIRAQNVTPHWEYGLLKARTLVEVAGTYEQ